MPYLLHYSKQAILSSSSRPWNCLSFSSFSGRRADFSFAANRSWSSNIQNNCFLCSTTFSRSRNQTWIRAASCCSHSHISLICCSSTFFVFSVMELLGSDRRWSHLLLVPFVVVQIYIFHSLQWLILHFSGLQSHFCSGIAVNSPSLSSDCNSSPSLQCLLSGFW